MPRMLAQEVSGKGREMTSPLASTVDLCVFAVL